MNATDEQPYELCMQMHTWIKSPFTVAVQEYYPPAPAPPQRPDLQSTGRNQVSNQTYKLEVCKVCGALRVPPGLLPRIVDDRALEWKERRKI